jgi:chromosome segregation protein
MRIKNIYIQGFKSFMEKMSINIHPGISAFVGPNGCGKSNIIDAIRWAMGEQSPKQLRGRHMEDLIFSGTDHLKPLGLAEVTVTLENVGKAEDSNEISVTRRLYRSNESEYLINKSACRLKDIQDLFMGTGLGNRTYSIIAQGEISSIIEYKPEDIRLLLEEAAGISAYKARREESLRKITLTKENLGRVEDVLYEIKRDMNSLKKQARKAIRFKEISAEIHRLELVFYSNSYNHLQLERINNSEILEKIAKEEKGLQETYSKSENSIGEINLELNEKEKTLSSIKDKVFSLREEHRKNEDMVEHLLLDQKRCRENLSKLNDEKSEIGQKIGEFKSEIQKITSRISELQQSIGKISELQRSHESSFNREKMSFEKIRDELKNEKIRITELSNNEAVLRSEIANYSEIITQIDSRKTRLEKESVEISQKIEELTYAINEKRSQRDELIASLKSAENDLREEKTRLNALEDEKKKRESERALAEGNLNVTLSQMSTLKDLIKNYEGYNSGVQTIMNTYQKGKSQKDKVLGVVADFIQAESEFETAVEAVLADKLQYVVVSKQEDAKEAIEYLRSKDVGRSYFLPVKEFEKEMVAEKEKIKLNGFKLLRKHIHSKEKFRPMIESLLGNAALVDNLGQALSFWNNGGGRQTLVTPEGDLVNEKGIIIGGRLGDDSVGLLKRRRMLDELSKETGRYQTIISKLQTALGELDLKSGKINSHIATLDEDRQAYIQETEDIDNNIFLLERETDQLIKHSDYIGEQLSSLADEREERRLYLNKIEQGLSACIDQKNETQQRVSNKENDLQDIEDALGKAEEDFSKMILTYNQQKEEQKGLFREKERINQFIHEMGLRINKVEGDIHSNRQQYEGYIKGEREKKEEIKNILQKQEILENEISGLEQECSILKNKLIEEEKVSASLRSRIGGLREEINEARLKKAKIDFQLDSIISQAIREIDIDLQRDFKEYIEENFSRSECEQRLKQQKAIKEKIGDVNLLAINDYQKLEERCNYITGQQQDLISSIDSLHNSIRRINSISRQKFISTLGMVNEKLKEVFPILFSGGKAYLSLIDENLPLESGVLVKVQPPGKKLMHMALLSGGEKALSAMALLFAVYLIKPSPFIIMDEADAPLDEANTGRFNELLRDISKSSQVIMITHNRKTMELADKLYGVTMDRHNISKIVSVDLSKYH